MFGLLLSYMRGLFVYCPILLVRFKGRGLFLWRCTPSVSHYQRKMERKMDEMPLTMEEKIEKIPPPEEPPEGFVVG